ncbi:MAG: DUF2058 domain-containing protein [Steroidobacteraceae bacterium]
MNTSLRDQLLKAGLVSENKIRQANREDEQRRRQLKNQPKSAANPAPQNAARQARAEKVARDQELSRRQHEKTQRRALQVQIDQLIEQTRLPRLESNDFYGFVDGGKIRRVAVDARRREAISRGDLAIVRYQDRHEVVPAETARRIRERDVQAVIAINDQKETAAPDDPYKDFVVPDDLKW